MMEFYCCTTLQLKLHGYMIESCATIGCINVQHDSVMLRNYKG